MTIQANGSIGFQSRFEARAKLALMVHEGHTTSAIASTLGLSRPTVTLWRERLARPGVQGLNEQQRPGRPRRIGEVQRLHLLALACEPDAPPGQTLRAPKGSVVRRPECRPSSASTPTLRRDAGGDRRHEFEYIRHGTQCLTAALDVHSGRVLSHCTDRRTQDDLVAFMEDVARARPSGDAT